MPVEIEVDFTIHEHESKQLYWSSQSPSPHWSPPGDINSEDTVDEPDEEEPMEEDPMILQENPERPMEIEPDSEEEPIPVDWSDDVASTDAPSSEADKVIFGRAFSAGYFPPIIEISDDSADEVERVSRCRIEINRLTEEDLSPYLRPTSSESAGHHSNPVETFPGDNEAEDFPEEMPLTDPATSGIEDYRIAPVESSLSKAAKLIKK